jgi:M6 family metalloprotease-like protein
MKKIEKIIVLVVFGILIGMNFVAAETSLRSEVSNEERETGFTSSDSPFLGEKPIAPDYPNNPEDTLGKDNPSDPNGPAIPLGSPAPPPPSGFNDPVTPQTGVVPLLTIFIEWTDAPPDITTTFVQTQLFGPRPSLIDYMLETSYGQFTYSDIGHYTWITAWDDPITPGDEASRDYWHTAPDPYYGGTFIAHGLVSLDKTGYDFAPLDFDNDGTIEFGDEVAYLMIDAMDPGLASDYRGGGNRPMPPLTLDGKSTSGAGCTVSENSPWITLYAHELAHEVFDLHDYYYITPQPVDFFTLMGLSGANNWTIPIGPHHIDPYYKMKLGWYSPTVVTSDGFYDIPDTETNPVAFILHDPTHGTHEYFMVENRWKGLSYDNSNGLIDPLTPPLPPADAPIDILDQGLLIWHVDETRDWDGLTTGGYPKVNLTRRGLTDHTAAFNSADVDYYDFYDGSSPLDAKWNTGTNSKCGAWAVSKTGQTMRAWLDVPGPGILEVLLTDSVSAIPGSSGTLSVRVVNTGDATDTFSFSVVGLPSDLTATTPGSVSLGSKAETIVDFEITPIRHWTTAPGIRSFKLRAESITDPSVFTEIDATIEVLPFGEPHVTIPINIRDVKPGDTTYYILDVYNFGNVVDDMSLSFTGIDFGTTYEAYPTAIPQSWINFNPTIVSASPGNSAKSNLTITVPSDWAGMENTTYDFMVTATSSITPDSHSETAHLIVHTTPESMMYYVKIELENLESDVDALSTDIKDGLLAKIHAAQNKLDQALERYLAGDDPPASNHLETVQNMMNAFLNLIDAQRDKKLTVAQADDFADKAKKIIEHIDARACRWWKEGKGELLRKGVSGGGEVGVGVT